MVGDIAQEVNLWIGDSKYDIHLIDFGNCNFSGDYSTPDDVIEWDDYDHFVGMYFGIE